MFAQHGMMFARVGTGYVVMHDLVAGFFFFQNQKSGKSLLYCWITCIWNTSHWRSDHRKQHTHRGSTMNPERRHRSQQWGRPETAPSTPADRTSLGRQRWASRRKKWFVEKKEYRTIEFLSFRDRVKANWQRKQTLWIDVCKGRKLGANNVVEMQRKM